MSNVRLPQVPAGVAAIMGRPVAPPPPPPPAPPTLQQGSDYEGGQWTFSPTAGPYPIDTPTSVYKTKRRWSGIDVYARILGSSGASLPYLRVWIYALTGNDRALVGSGWLIVRDGATSRIAVARTIATNFEVVAELCSVGVTHPTVSLSFVASDECLDVDPSDVAVSLTGGYISNAPAILPLLSPAAPNPAHFLTQLTGAVVTNTTAAVLYWQAVDSATIPVLATAPLVSVAIPPKTTVWLGSEQLSGYRFGSAGTAGGLICGGSTAAASFSAGTAVAAGDILQQVWGC